MFKLFIESDVVSFKERQCSLVNPTPVPRNDFDVNIITLGKFSNYNEQIIIIDKLQIVLFFFQMTLKHLNVVVHFLDTMHFYYFMMQMYNQLMQLLKN